MSASTNPVENCHCGRPSTHTEFSPYMHDYCDECTLSRCDLLSAADCPVSRRPGRRMGQPDAMALCETCKLTIDRQWWGNGGWLWVHRNGSVDCYPRAHANPADGTIRELFPSA